MDKQIVIKIERWYKEGDSQSQVPNNKIYRKKEGSDNRYRQKDIYTDRYTYINKKIARYLVIGSTEINSALTMISPFLGSGNSSS